MSGRVSFQSATLGHFCAGGYMHSRAQVARRNSDQISLVALPIVVVLLPFAERTVHGFIGVVFGARDWHDRRAANIFRCGDPLSAVRTEIAQLLSLSAEVHRIDPAGAFAVIARAAVAELRGFAKSGLERASNRPNDCLTDERGLESVSEGEANRAAGDARSHVRHSDAHNHEDDRKCGIGEHVSHRKTSGANGGHDRAGRHTVSGPPREGGGNGFARGGKRRAPLVGHLHSDGEHQVEEKEPDTYPNDVAEVTFGRGGSEAIGAKPQQDYSASNDKVRLDQGKQKHRRGNNESKEHNEGGYALNDGQFEIRDHAGSGWSIEDRAGHVAPDLEDGLRAEGRKTSDRSADTGKTPDDRVHP
jgi:hypothetical protein